MTKPTETIRARWTFVAFCLVLAVLAFVSEKVRAYDLLIGPQPHTEKYWYYNESDCGSHQTSIEAAVATWNFYGAKLRYAGETSSEKLLDGLSVFYCMTLLDFVTELGLPYTVRGATYYWHWDGVIVEADFVLNSSYSNTDCTTLHEIGHVIGLGHSTVKGSAMESGAFRCNLHYDDILGVSALYGIKPNCTPYFTGEFAYFPYIGGFWAKLVPVDMADFTKGFMIAEDDSGVLQYGPSPDADWQCATYYSGEFLQTKMLYKGRLHNVNLRRVNGVFYLF